MMKLPKTGDIVADQEGRAYKLGEIIGRGGQGIVFREANNLLAIKIYTGQDPKARAEYEQRFQMMAYRKTLPDILVKPEAVLSAPHIGYVMTLVKKHTALKDLSYYNHLEDIQVWYNEQTGGLRRRLILGAKIARAFSEIQYSGLAYCDISPNNVLVSKELTKSTICLIDCDNLSAPGSTQHVAIGTPWYIAPEILAGRHLSDSLSDNHSLAVMLFQLLTLEHPLMGDMIKNGEPELEKRALFGEYSYIAHPSQTENSLTSGLPLGMVLSNRLQQLFARAFVDGLHNRMRRPTPGEWEEALWMASYMTCRCPQCNASQYSSTKLTSTCAWCDYSFENAPLAIFQTGILDEEAKDEKWRASEPVGAYCLDQDVNYLPQRLCLPGALGDWGDKTTAVMHRIRGTNSFMLENVSDMDIELQNLRGRQRVGKGKTINVLPGDHILFPQPSQGVLMTRRRARIHKI